MRKLILAGCVFAAAATMNAQGTTDCPMHKEHAGAAQEQQAAPGAVHEDASTAAAQHQHHAAPAASPYTERTALPIKALTKETLDAYRNGTGNGLAIPAELNGYPGPRHILDLADELHLTADQKTLVEGIYRGMHDSAVQMGGEIIDREKALDDVFARSAATDADVAALTQQIATLQGRLRYTHLTAHVAAKAVLTAEQLKIYAKARGYAQ